jgi:phosphotransferase system IIB component
MKKESINKLFFFILFIMLANNVFGQNVNAGIFFQAIARDSYSNPAKNRVIYVQSSIIQSNENGIVVLKEQHKTNTDAAGVFSISVGNGTRIGGTAFGMGYIQWSQGPFFLGLKIAIEPVAPLDNWNYSSELIDLGIAPFGAVPYALYAENPNKVNISDSIKKYVTPTQLKAVKFDSSYLSARVDNKVNLSDSTLIYVTPAQLNAKTFDSNPIYNQLSLKANISDLNFALGNNSNITSVTNSITSITNSVTTINDSINSVNNSIASINSVISTKANTQSVTNLLGYKEDLINKSTSFVADGSSNTKYPSVKSVKDYVDGQIVLGVASVTIQDATSTLKGKIKLAGDLTGTADAPTIANGSITNAKIATGIDASKITGTFSGNAATATFATNANYSTSAGTASSSIIANSASTATTANIAGNITATSNTSLTSLNNLNTVGTITAGTWSASTIDITHGGTGATTKATAFNALSPLTTTGDLLYASASNTSNRLSIGSNGNVLTVSAGAPTWASPINTTLNLGTLSSGLTNGATLTTSGSNSTLTLGVADAYNAGFVSTSNQTFGGTKTFNNDIIVSGLKFGGTLNTSNAFIGNGALSSLTTGYDNYAIGYNAMNATTTGHWNVGIGSNSLSSNTTGFWNTAVGDNSLRSVINTIGNTAIGNYALNVSTGNYNTAIGSSSLSLLTSGNYNVAIGASSAGTITSTESIFIGYGASAASNTSTNETVIGYNVSGYGNNTTSIGNSFTTMARIYGDLILGPTYSSSNYTDAGDYPLQVNGNSLMTGNATANLFHSTVATGTAPFTVESTTPVANLSIGGNAATASNLSTMPNYAQLTEVNPINVSTASTFPAQVIFTSINTTGHPVHVTVYGDLKVQFANEYCSVRLYRGTTALGSDVMINNLTTDGASAPFNLSVIDNPSAGSYIYYLKITAAGGPAGTISFGATTAPTISLLEIR